MLTHDLLEEQLPRDSSLMGLQLRIVQTLDHRNGDTADGIAITDGERTALYVRDRLLTAAELKRTGPDDAKNIPQIIPFYIEPGRFTEAHRVAIFEGKQTALYVPSRILMADQMSETPEREHGDFREGLARRMVADRLREDDRKRREQALDELASGRLSNPDRNGKAE